MFSHSDDTKNAPTLLPKRGQTPRLRSFRKFCLVRAVSDPACIWRMRHAFVHCPAAFACPGRRRRSRQRQWHLRIDAVTVFPSGAEITRAGQVKLEKGEHDILFTDLPSAPSTASIRVEGKAAGGAGDRLGRARSLSVPRNDDAIAATERKRVEDAIEKLKDHKVGPADRVQAAETQKTADRNLAQASDATGTRQGAAPPQPDWAQLFG